MRQVCRVRISPRPAVNQGPLPKGPIKTRYSEPCLTDTGSEVLLKLRERICGPLQFRIGRTALSRSGQDPPPTLDLSGPIYDSANTLTATVNVDVGRFP